MRRFLPDIGYAYNEEYGTEITKNIFDFGNIFLKGYPKLEDLLTKTLLTLNEFHNENKITICVGGTQDLFFASGLSLLYSQIKLLDFIVP